MVQTARSLSRSAPLFVVPGLALCALVVGGAVALAATGSPDAGAVLVLAPLLILVSLPFLSREAERQADRGFFWVLVLALVLKLTGAVVRYYVAFDIYEGVADAAGYHGAGAQIAERFRAGVFDTGLATLGGTDFIKFFTGIVYTVVGPTELGGFFVYSWLGFWGLFFLHRAFTIALPDGRRRQYAYLLFFLPSLVFWPSSTGKEAWMIFSLGLAALGVARIMSWRTWRGLMIAGIGLWLASIVRPHVAGLMAIALAVGFLFRRGRKDLGVLAPIGKALGLGVALVLAFVLVSDTEEFLKQSSIRTEGGVRAVLEQTSERTAIGGSRFRPSILESPHRTPISVATVLYRPFILEAHNAQAFAASLETALLLVVSLVRVRWILGSLRRLRQQPYVAFTLSYVGLFIVAFSAIANFGLLARERVQMLPLFLVLLCLPPPAHERRTLDARDLD